MLNEKQLERIVAVHGETKGLASTAVKILCAEKINTSVKEIIACWGERGLKGYKYSDYIRMKIKEYAAQFGQDIEKITETLKRDLQPVSSVEYATVIRVMKELELYSPGKRGGSRRTKYEKNHDTQQAKKNKSEKLAHYQFCMPPEIIGKTIR